MSFGKTFQSCNIDTYRQPSSTMKRLLVSIKKKVDPTHKLITTEWITEDELKEIRKKYGNQFDPDEPIIQYLNDQVVLISFLIWINE